jgi:hypothetical protein
MGLIEDSVHAELAWVLRAGAPERAVRLTVREIVVGRLERGHLDVREVSDAVESTVRAAYRLMRELDASPEVVETICRAALEAVRGHGGETARWLPEVTSMAAAVLDALAWERADDERLRWIARRLSRW